VLHDSYFFSLALIFVFRFLLWIYIFSIDVSNSLFLSCVLCGFLQTRTEGFRSLGVLQSLKKLLKHEGVQGFYK
jgi:hypothetical protein